MGAVDRAMGVDTNGRRQGARRWRGLVAVIAIAAAAAVDASPTWGKDALLGGSCCFSRRAGLNVCSPGCPGVACPSCGYPHPTHHANGCANCGADKSLGAGFAQDQELSEPGPDGIADLEPAEFGGEPEAEFEGIAASFGATARGADVLPSMVGDFFGGGITMFLPSIKERGGGTATILPVAGGDRRFKLSENNSPFPTDRVFVNFNHFKNAIQDVDVREFSLDRYTFGVEKTFVDGQWSLELRIPFAYGLDSTQLTGSTELNSATEFGNVPLVLKRLLVRRERWAAAAGLALILPTAEDAFVTDGFNSVTVENEAYHLQPFLGAYYAPHDRFWSLAFVQADFDTNGNTTTFFGPAFGQSSTPGADSGRGVLQDQNALYMDLGCGYWLLRDSSRSRLLSGIASLLELHYSTTMQDGDRVFADNGRDAVGGLTVTDRNAGGSGTAARRLDVLNLTAALRFELGRRSQLTVAGVAPLRTGDDKLFDAEFDVQYVWSF